MEYHTFKYPNGTELRIVSNDIVNDALASGDPILYDVLINAKKLDASLAGKQPRRKHQHLTMQELEQIQRLYAQGSSRKDIAAKFSVTYATVYMHTR